jgi:hypothetical protein
VGGGDPYEEVYSNAGVGSPISPDYRGPKVLLFPSGILYDTFFTFEGTIAVLLTVLRIREVYPGS